MAHRHLMLPTIVGVPIVSSVAILMLLSLITSFVIYPKWYQGFFRKPRRAHRKYFWGDMHRLCGVWSLWLVLVVTITGIWYLVEVLGLKATYPERGTAMSEQSKAGAVMPTPAVFNTMVAATAQQFPELEIKKAFFPRRGGNGVIFQGQTDTILTRPRANMISFDPVSAQQLALNRGEDLSVHARISEAADPLHFGTFAGLPSKIIYFIFGAILSTLAVTGTYLYGLRITRVARDDPKPQAKFWLAAFKQMRWGKWLSLFFIAICLIITVALFGGFVTP